MALGTRVVNALRHNYLLYLTIQLSHNLSRNQKLNISREMEPRVPLTGRVRNSKPLFRSRRQYQPDESASTSSSDAFVDDFTEPPLNIPKAWRKASKYDGWMQRIMHPETPLPTIEGPASSQNLTPPESISGSPRKEPETPMWNADTDFTAGSLDMSPQLKVRIRNLARLQFIYSSLATIHLLENANLMPSSYVPPRESHQNITSILL